MTLSTVVAIIVIVVSVIWLVDSAFRFRTAQTKYDELNAKYNTLKIQYESMMAKYNALLKEREDLSAVGPNPDLPNVDTN